MASAWPTFTFEESLSGAGAKTAGQQLFDRDPVVAEKRTHIAYELLTTTGVFPQTLVTGWRIRHPSWIEAGDKLVWEILASVSTALETGSARMVVGGVNGTTATITVASFQYYQSVVTLGAVGGTVETITLQGGITGGATLSINAEFRCGNLYYEAA